MKQCVLDNGDIIIYFDGLRFTTVTPTTRVDSYFSVKELSNLDSSARQMAFISLCIDSLHDVLQSVLRLYLKELNTFLCDCYEETLRYRLEDFVELISDVSNLNFGYYKCGYEITLNANLFNYSERDWILCLYTTSERRLKLTLPSTMNFGNEELNIILLGFLCYTGFFYSKGEFIKAGYLQNLLKLNTALPKFNWRCIHAE